MASIELRAEAQRSLGFGSIGASYASIGTEIARPIRILIVQNLTNALLQFSFDGVVDHFVLPANGQFVLDITTNREENAQGFYVSRGTNISVKRIGVPTSGAVYVSTMYARGS
jgi:hypothetical protein